MKVENLKCVATVERGSNQVLDLGTLKVGTKIYIEPPARPAVKLELSGDEAQTLYTLLHYIGGCPVASRRGHTQNISDKLNKLGVELLEDRKSFIDKDRSSAHALYIAYPMP